MNSYCAIILAAGDGRRMKSSVPKVMCEVLGDPMLGWVLDSVRDAGIPDDCTGIVVGNNSDMINNYLGKAGEYRTFIQPERKGTGDAVKQAKELIAGSANVLVLYGDAPFADGDTITAALNEHIHRGNDVTVVTAELPDPTDYGRVIRTDTGSFSAIIEQRDCTLVQLGITEVNSGIYWFRSEALLKALDGLGCDNAAGEYYLTDTVGIIVSGGGKAGTFTAVNTDIVLGANSRSELLRLNIIAKMNVIEQLLDDGVEFVSTDGVIIGSPNYLGDISAGMHCLMERVMFQNITYQTDPRLYREPNTPTLFIVTSNAPDGMYQQGGFYADLLQSKLLSISHAIGPTRPLVCGNTLQVEDYSRYNWTMFDAKQRQSWHDKMFPLTRELATEMGAELVNDPWARCLPHLQPSGSSLPS